MADVVSTNVLENGSQWFRAVFTNVSDGTGESGVVKIDPTSGAVGANNQGVVIQGNTLYPGVHLKVMGIRYNVTGGTLRLQWKATSNQDLWLLNGFDHLKFRKEGGIGVPQSSGAPITGANGQIVFTTLGFGAGSSYTVEIWCKKDIVQ